MTAEQQRYEHLISENDKLRARLAEVEHILASIGHEHTATPREAEGFTERKDDREATIQDYQREIITLHRISEMVLREQPLSVTLHEVIQEVSACTGFPIAAIEFYDEARQIMQIMAATGIPIPSNNASFYVPIAQTLSGIVAHSGQALIETCAQDRPEYANVTLRLLGVQTFICVPMRVMDRVIGTIALAHPDRIQLNERIVPLTYSLANFIAALVARKRAEEQSAASERQMREILDKIAAGVLLMDTEGRYHFANQRGASMFGLTPAEVIGKSIADLLSPETSQSYLERTRRFIATQSFEEYEDTFTHPRGTRTFFIADQVLTNEQGEGYALLTSSIDITERKQNENALRQSEHAFRTLYESMRDAFVSVDMSGKIRQYNSSFKELVGYTDEELTWLTYEDITPNQWHVIEERIVQEQILPHGYSEVYEKEYRTKSGRIIPIELRTVLTYDEDGQPSGMWAIIRDITLRKRNEAALHQTMEELTRSNADLEQFAYVASHDLQEPLRAVTGMVQLLQQRYQGQIDARADQYIALAVEAATRMQALINDLLAFSRLERCGKPFVPTAAASALDGARMNLQVAIQESGAIITHDELPVVLADPTQLLQIFQNLLSNAIKFRSEETPHIHITAERRANVWCFSVQDNGIGIAPDYFTRIFVIFQRLHSRRAYPGTGIGLALCKKIVERHGGQIWVESRLGHGATFSFTIPDSERTYGSVITSQTD